LSLARNARRVIGFARYGIAMRATVTI